uniref:3-dmu-9_3-mt domain-containing protein n=1 Tax=Heterorhabditis bacteriophora TaxID=37862 RepID=A0A1I7XD98_HETBA
MLSVVEFEDCQIALTYFMDSTMTEEPVGSNDRVPGWNGQEIEWKDIQLFRVPRPGYERMRASELEKTES